MNKGQHSAFEDVRRESGKLNRRAFLTVAATASTTATCSLSGARALHAHADPPAETELTTALEGEQTMTEKRGGKELDFLMNYPTTLLESAVSLIKGTHDGISFTRPGLERRFPKTERLVGYAVTSLFSTDLDDARGRRDNLNYWNYAYGVPGPKVAISVDASREPGSGSSWGQLNAHIHKALGCRGVLTNGGVRDIGQFEALGFQVFSSHLTIGHGNPHFIAFGDAVTLAGVTFRSGDVVCADEHGAIVIPKSALPDIDEAVAEVTRRVGAVARYCSSSDFTPAGLAEAAKSTKPTTPWKPSRRK